MPDSSLNYALIMERFIKQRTKTQEKAAAFLAISVGEVQEILQTGRVSVKVNKALTRMAPNLDLSEHESEVPEDANAEAENVPVSAPEVAPSVAPRAMTPEDLIASSYTPEVAPSVAPKAMTPEDLIASSYTPEVVREVAPKAMTPEDLIASSYTPEVTTPVERKAPPRVPEVEKPEARNVSTNIPLSVTPSNEVVAEERDTTSAMSDATEVEKSRPIDLKKLDREGAQFIKVTERISAAEASLDDEGEKPDCKRRSDNVPRRRLDSLNVAVENRTVCHLPIESIETLMEGDKDVHRGHVFARAQGVPGRGYEHQGGVPGVRAAPRHRAQDALAPRATGIPQEAPSPSPQA